MRMIIWIISAALVLSACDYGASSPRGFSLPAGDPLRGETLFADYGCLDCHQIAGEPAEEEKSYTLGKAVVIGGRVSQITTYAELVTSIINPSHKLTRRYPQSFTAPDGNSKMPTLNDQMTVTDLIDLVAYLQPKYHLVPYRTTEYGLYPAIDDN
ncbi:cytochrome C [Alteromonas aestuariivivens]|uniref:Cytochrome C n=1 Tax=Alteromonas aestuariivivens TaxID=1938339 RepID=A0A3D8M354_9ALTE|nr:c-type cytochrome [Alteromonas aestuariivivens]RDV24119.1 cytochrome C [Alteromonas aestuariivivens]